MEGRVGELVGKNSSFRKEKWPDSELFRSGLIDRLFARSVSQLAGQALAGAPKVGEEQLKRLLLLPSNFREYYSANLSTAWLANE